MKTFIHNLVDHFGFENMHDFATSLIHFKLLKITIPMGGLIACCSTILGFDHTMFMAFFVMVLFELGSGVCASILEGKKIVSKKISRFGFKLLTWLILIYITHVFAEAYKDEGAVIAWFTSAFHETIIGYIMWEYIISILENMERITGREIPLKKYLNELLDKYITKR